MVRKIDFEIHDDFPEGIGLECQEYLGCKMCDAVSMFWGK